MRNKTTSPSLQLMNPIGTCTLVGAGPGDPDLITMKAVKAIAAATVLLVDDLVFVVAVEVVHLPSFVLQLSYEVLAVEAAGLLLVSRS